MEHQLAQGIGDGGRIKCVGFDHGLHGEALMDSAPLTDHQVRLYSMVAELSNAELCVEA
jgi:hypothetical protein